MGLQAGPSPSLVSRIPWKRITLAIVSVVVLLIVVDFGIGWYYSGEIEKDGLKIDHSSEEFDLDVTEVGADRIVLGFEEDGAWNEAGLWGLEGEAGYGQVGEIVTETEGTVTRRFTLLEGAIVAGEKARTTGDAFPGDPQRAHGMAFDDVTVAAPIGDLPAWYVDGDDDTWAIFVHGRTANQTEALRTLPLAVSAGLPSLVISYRNDVGVPEDPTGYYQFGGTEWEDLEAAAQYALANGANDLVLLGFSMGGGVCASFLYESALANRVSGVILDAPMLDFGATVDFATQRRNLPGFVGATAKWLSALRFDVDWGGMDFLRRVDELQAPVLLFHGDEDTTVPIGTSRTLAEQRPDIVRYVEVEGARHVGAWNRDQVQYQREVGDFLTRVAK